MAGNLYYHLVVQMQHYTTATVLTTDNIIEMLYSQSADSLWMKVANKGIF